MPGLPPLCVLTPPLASAADAIDASVRLSRGGVAWLQVRLESVSDRDLLEVAATLVRETADRTLVTVNDRPDVALLAGARSVHVGDRDLLPRAVRELLGADAVIGLSTHGVEEALEAARIEPVDYVALGPIFASSTKRSGPRALGVEAIAELRRRGVERPIVAIGGIEEGNAAEVIAAGATAVAVVAAVWDGGGDPLERALRILEKVR